MYPLTLCVLINLDRYCPFKMARTSRKTPDSRGPKPNPTATNVCGTLERFEGSDKQNQGFKKSKTAGKPMEIGPTGKPKRRPDQPKKVKRRDQKIIPVPRTDFANDGGESDDEIMGIDLGEEDGLDTIEGAEIFLKGVNKTALSR